MAETTPNNVGAAQAGRDPEANKPSTRKPETKKIVRLLTVVAYMMSVSMAAIMLSAYYIFLWNPKEHRPGPGGPLRLTDTHPCPECLLAVSVSNNAPVYNESQMAETPRVLPALEELFTSPLPPSPSPVDPVAGDSDPNTDTEGVSAAENYTLPLPAHVQS